jgi:EAL domain-containing protein (putative c-di-GMP-specific phosphodiesterase class I)
MTYRQSFRAGALVFREGEPGDRAFIIERGAVEVTALKQGRPLVLAELGPGELFGEMALIDDELRSATAMTLEPTDVLVVPREYFRERLDRADPILSVFLRVVLDRFRVTHQARLTGEFPARPPSIAPDSDDLAFSEERDEAVRELSMRDELERALAGDELTLHYQPVVSLADGRLVGLEALMRWRHPRRGEIPPGEFIRFAEQTGMIMPMGLWAIEQAGGVLRRLQHVWNRVCGELPQPYVSVNVSADELSDLGHVEQLLEALVVSGVGLPNVKLELTETLLMQDPQAAAVALERLRARGVSLAVDDFGTGYSSLSYLHRFPIDTVKLDRSFVDAMLRQPASMKIVRSIVHLSHDLELQLVAEGLETNEQRTVLTELGCDHAQGYLLARPAPVDETVALVESTRGRFELAR